MGNLKSALLNMIPDPMIVFFARPYITGSSLESALKFADKFHKKNGTLGTIDLLGEDLKVRDDVIKARDLYLHILDEIVDRKYCSISVKPGQMGYYVDKDFCRENIDMICKKGFEKQVQVTVDMEDTDQTDFTLDLYQTVMKKYPGTGGVLQSRLWRTRDDIELFNGINGIFRLCIGIYIVPGYSYQTKRAMKENLLCLLKTLLDKGHTVQIATHDEAIVKRAIAYLDEWKAPKERIEFQLLMGVPRGRMIKEIQAKGYNVRLYLPFCTEWRFGVAYLRRRLNANPNFMFYVMQNIMRGSI
jgi:proline dehydrogenase